MNLLGIFCLFDISFTLLFGQYLPEAPFPALLLGSASAFPFFLLPFTLFFSFAFDLSLSATVGVC